MRLRQDVVCQNTQRTTARRTQGNAVTYEIAFTPEARGGKKRGQRVRKCKRRSERDKIMVIQVFVCVSVCVKQTHSLAVCSQVCLCSLVFESSVHLSQIGRSPLVLAMAPARQPLRRLEGGGEREREGGRERERDRHLIKPN